MKRGLLGAITGLRLRGSKHWLCGAMAGLRFREAERWLQGAMAGLRLRWLRGQIAGSRYRRACLKCGLLGAFALLAGACTDRFAYTLDGRIEGLTDSVALADRVTGEIVARIPVRDGRFHYEGRHDQPTLAALGRDGRQVAACYLERGHITIEGRLDPEQAVNHDGVEYYPSGTPANDAYGAHLRFVHRVLRAYNFGRHTPEYRAALLDSLAQAPPRNLRANIGNLFGVSLLGEMLRNDPTLTRERADSLVRLLPRRLRKSRLLHAALQDVEQIFRVQELTRYIDFEAPTPDGATVALRDAVARSRYVLLDFWFANCGGCRAEVPHMKRAYAAYRDRGFEIVAVSRDEAPGPWKQAIAEACMPWINVLDSDRRICALYGVIRFPTNFLIDCATGRIVGRNLRGRELDEALAKHYSEP